MAKNLPKIILPLTSIRFFIAIWVMFFHLRPLLLEAFPVLKILDPIINKGYFGVDFFFILSGFVIWLNYADRLSSNFKFGNINNFMLNRIVRLLPVNILTTFISLIILIISIRAFNYFGNPIPDWFNLISFLQTSFMLQLVNQPTVIYVWNQPAWAVSAEFILYLFFPIIVLLFSKVKKTRTIKVMIFMVFSIYFFLNFSNITSIPYAWLIKAVFDFLFGVLFSILYLNTQNKSSKFLSFINILIPIFVIVLLFVNGSEMFLIPLIALWIFSLSVAKNGLTKILSRPILVKAGSISFSIFMLHWAFISILNFSLFKFPILKNPINYQISVIIIVLIILISSFLCWKYFEEPIRLKLKKKLH